MVELAVDTSKNPPSASASRTLRTSSDDRLRTHALLQQWKRASLRPRSHNARCTRRARESNATARPRPPPPPATRATLPERAAIVEKRLPR